MKGPFSYSYGDQFHVIKVTVDWRAIRIQKYTEGTRQPIDYFGDPKISVLKFGSAALANRIFSLLMRTCCPTTRTRTWDSSNLVHIASTSESVTREGAIPVVE